MTIYQGRGVSSCFGDQAFGPQASGPDLRVWFQVEHEEEAHDRSTVSDLFSDFSRTGIRWSVLADGGLIVHPMFLPLMKDPLKGTVQRSEWVGSRKQHIGMVRRRQPPRVWILSF
jgi:hypothetical protein